MNHTIKASPISGLCMQCGRDEASHSNTAQCEACSNQAPCEIVNNMLLCKECQEREAAVISNRVDEPNRDRIVELLNKLDKEIPSDSKLFFTNEITAIVDIEKQLEGEADARYALAEAVHARIEKFKRVLFEAKQLIVEARAAGIADQRYLNQLIPTLREEQRAKFREFDISYKPTIVAPAPSGPKVRMSASDKAIASMAKLLGISEEQARKSMAAAVGKVTGEDVKCTCQETPGICRVHPK